MLQNGIRYLKRVTIDEENCRIGYPFVKEIHCLIVCQVAPITTCVRTPKETWKNQKRLNASESKHHATSNPKYISHKATWLHWADTTAITSYPATSVCFTRRLSATSAVQVDTGQPVEEDEQESVTSLVPRRVEEMEWHYRALLRPELRETTDVQ